MGELRLHIFGTLYEYLMALRRKRRSSSRFVAVFQMDASGQTGMYERVKAHV